MVDIPHADRLEAKIDKLLEKVARLETLTATEADRCPFRVEIAKGANNVVRLEKVETRTELVAVKLAEKVVDTANILAKKMGEDSREMLAKIDRNAENIQLLKLNWAKLVGLMVGAGAAGGVISEGIAKLFN